MLKKFENGKIKKIVIGSLIPIFAIVVAIVSILITNKGEKTKTLIIKPYVVI